jgi:penicillin-binding protein 2
VNIFNIMPKDIFSINTESKKTNFHRDRKMQWVEDAYIAGSDHHDYLTSNFNFSKLKIIFLISALIFISLLVRLVQLQIVHGQEYRVAAEENRIRIKDIKAPRGIIYDRLGNTLVHNIPNFTLTFTPADLPKNQDEKNALIDLLSTTIGVPKSEIEKIISDKPSDSYLSYTLYDHIQYDKAIQLRVTTSNYSGVSLDVGTFREYQAGLNFSHLLGYLGKSTPQELLDHPSYAYDDYIGKTGIESYYENLLKGTNGKKEIEVDSFGKESKIINKTEPKTGTNLTLTIDKELQDTLGDALEKTISSSKSITGAAAVAIDVNTGELLALVSSPSFDNNKLTVGLSQAEYNDLINNPKKPLFDRFASGEYPSGSTIKPLIALAGLQEGVITPSTTVMSTGGIRIDKWFFPDWKAGGHGLTDVRKALAESVNTFFYMVGGGYENVQGLGVKKITDYLRLFGLGQPSGLDLPNEASGFLPSMEWKEKVKKEKWYIGDTYHLSIGQGDLLVTPLQVANYTAAIANGGTLYKPHLIKSMTDVDGKTTITQPEIIRSNFIGSPNYQVVREGLRQGVLSGSSTGLRDLPFSSAAKTGTAQYGDNKTHAWFTAFAPYENPTIAITVIVEGGGEGHLTALPVAKQGLLNWFSRNPIP